MLQHCVEDQTQVRGKKEIILCGRVRESHLDKYKAELCPLHPGIHETNEL